MQVLFNSISTQDKAMVFSQRDLPHRWILENTLAPPGGPLWWYLNMGFIAFNTWWRMTFKWTSPPDHLHNQNTHWKAGMGSRGTRINRATNQGTEELSNSPTWRVAQQPLVAVRGGSRASGAHWALPCSICSRVYLQPWVNAVPLLLPTAQSPGRGSGIQNRTGGELISSCPYVFLAVLHNLQLTKTTGHLGNLTFTHTHTHIVMNNASEARINSIRIHDFQAGEIL